MEPLQFEAVDPRGWKVICTEDRWKWHILSGHRAMPGYEEETKQAIEAPTFGIYRDAARETRDIYYLKLERSKSYLKVVVDFGEDEIGDVKTAYKTDSIKKGEQLIWPISTNS